MQNKTILLFLLFLVSITLSAQKQVNSPYSRFNIGTLEPAGPFRSQAMGGISTGIRENKNIYFTNPASYSSIDTNSFVFDFGLDYSMNKLSSGDMSYTSDDMNFDHLVIGLPISKNIGLAAGVVPLSNGYYRLEDQVLKTDPEYNPVIGQYTSSHQGKGGFNNFFIGMGFDVWKNLSAGINMNILFGDLNRTNQFLFDDLYNVYHNNSNEVLRMSGINFDYGLQYSQPLKKDLFINAGVSFSGAANYKTDYENYTYRYTLYGTRDTISYTSGAGSRVKMPGTFRAGISFGKTNKFVAGIDYVATNWSKSVIPGSEGYTADVRSIHIGAEYTPERFSNTSFIKRMDYRAGFHTGTNYLIVNGDQLKETGVSAGFGIPIGPEYSKVNVFVDYTTRKGPESSGLHKENYFTVGVSLNLYDYTWFIKKKYD